MTHQPTGVTAEASERRSQEANLSSAIRRLRINLALDVRQPVGDALSDLWHQRCRNGAIHMSVDHEDFPSLLAEALDELAAVDWDASIAVQRLTCTLSQLVKLLHKEPRALRLLNDHRQTAGLRPLRSPN